MADQAPNIDLQPGASGRLVYDKARRTIVTVPNSPKQFSMAIATAIWQAWVEMNAIRARDGIPYQSEAGGLICKASVCPDYWSKCVDDLEAAYLEHTGFSIMPWSPSTQFRSPQVSTGARQDD